MAKAKKAKAAKKEKAAPAAVPAKRTLAANRRRRRARRNPEGGSRALAANPPIAADFTHVLLPGFAAYAVTRVLSRIVYSVVQKRWPKLGKHAAALAGVAGFGTTWFFAHKIKRVAAYHDGIVMGSGVAALHGMAQCYLPAKYNWLLADCKPEDVTPIAKPATTTVTAAATPISGDEYSYLEAQLGDMETSGDRRTRIARPPKAHRTPVADAMAFSTDGGGGLDHDLSDALDADEDVDDLYTGPFAQN